MTSTQEFVKGTPFAELELPAEATAKFENAANEPLPAIWTESGYKPNATHILKGGVQSTAGLCRESEKY